MEHPPSDDRLPRLQSPALATRWFVIIVAIAVGVWDLVVYLVWGGPATVSTQIGNWFASSWGWVLLPVTGFVVGHLVGMMPIVTPAVFGRLALFGFAMVVGYWVTRLT